MRKKASKYESNARYEYFNICFIFKSKIINDVIKALSEEHEIIIASYCVDELINVVEDKFNVSREKIYIFLSKFPFSIVQSPLNVKKKIIDIRDENDYIILHTAIMENVDILITGDKDFKEIKINRPKILIVREFYEKFCK